MVPAPVAAKQAPLLKPQTHCPITGSKVDKKHFVDAGGYRFYLCCPRCGPKITKNPGKYLALLKEKGQTPEKLPSCSWCGQTKGSPECCTKKSSSNWW